MKEGKGEWGHERGGRSGFGGGGKDGAGVRSGVGMAGEAYVLHRWTVVL